MNNTNTSTTTTGKFNNNHNKKRHTRHNTKHILILILVICLVIFQFITFKPESYSSASTIWSSSTSTSISTSTTNSSETPPTTTTKVVSSNNNIAITTKTTTSPTTSNTTINETPVVVRNNKNNKNADEEESSNNNNNNNSNSNKEESTVFMKTASHGFGVDLLMASGHLLKAAEKKAQLHVTWTRGWLYAKGVCPEEDMSCYFEPPIIDYDDPKSVPQNRREALQKLLTPKPDIRKELETSMVPVPESCAVIHVRHADIKLNFGRAKNKTLMGPVYKYLELGEYVEAFKKEKTQLKDIVLLTDDQDVIDDVPNYDGKEDGLTFHYLKRKRFRGAEGGWENHFPSGSKKEELLTILRTKELVSKCSLWVGTTSSFADILRQLMDEMPKVIELKNMNWNPRSNNEQQRLAAAAAAAVEDISKNHNKSNNTRKKTINSRMSTETTTTSTTSNSTGFSNINAAVNNKTSIIIKSPSSPSSPVVVANKEEEERLVVGVDVDDEKKKQKEEEKNKQQQQVSSSSTPAAGDDDDDDDEKKKGKEKEKNEEPSSFIITGNSTGKNNNTVPSTLPLVKEEEEEDDPAANNILASKILMDNDVSALLLEAEGSSTNNNKEIKFEPGSLTLPSSSHAEVLNYCYTNTTLYKNHFHEQGGFRFAASDTHQLIYLFLPKSSSSTARSMLKKRFDAYERNTGRKGFKLLIDDEPYTNYTAFTFVRDPLSRFFSGYDEAFVREAPWNHAHRQTGIKQITPSYIHEGIQFWYEFVDIWCPPSSRVNGTSDRSECYTATQTFENGTLAARLTRYVNETNFGFAPFNVHLKLQVPLLSDPKTGYKARVDEIYTMDEIESRWEYLSKRHSVNISEPVYSMKHEKIVEGVIHDRPRSRREDMTKISNSTKQRICEFGLLDYCCLNIPLPSPCTNLYCKLHLHDDGSGGSGGGGGDGGGKQQQNNNGGKNYRLQIQPWSFPFPT